MKIEFKNIPNAPDKDKDILINGTRVGSIGRGWLRLGGEQWVTNITGMQVIGAKTLKEAKRNIAANFSLK